jgi:hypothetical protein
MNDDSNEDVAPEIVGAPVRGPIVAALTEFLVTPSTLDTSALCVSGQDRRTNALIT